MENTDQRHIRRFTVVISAIVSDRQQQNEISCTILQGSISGCKILSKQVSDLPEEILIKIPDLDQLIKGRIIWRNQDLAGIEFEWESNNPDERRNAPRQEVVIPAILKDYDLNKLADCIICDASRTGCRISCETLSELPNDLHIEIPGLTGPVLALMVWRKDNMAGMEFLWETEIYMLDDTPAS
jgi:hypothetical protein